MCSLELIIILFIFLVLCMCFWFCYVNKENSYFGSGPDIFNPDDTVHPYDLYNYDNRQEPVYYKSILPTLD